MKGKVSDYLRGLIKKQVDDKRIVVWYDPEGHYREFVKSLDLPATPLEKYDDSFFALRQMRRRLNAERDLFTGEFWAGLESVRLGLADGIAHPVPRLKALYGDKIRFEVHGMRRPLLRRLGLSADLLMDAAEDRAAFQRFGTRG